MFITTMSRCWKWNYIQNKRKDMKYLEVTFTTHPCNETVNDVVSALAGEIGFESFVECEGGNTGLYPANSL